ncbi:MAG: DJ-1/PfpI family protein [Aphanothece saxicola GSE-SYN-MK-01-06B]|jgi:transcriptional regulator GlxA family with amidase domain|nr:DJ-1/PfpI family protein [Aphanothece saxicola GSE-SYN-MK-01-06B]
MPPAASTGERTGTFGILLFPGVEELDAIGPWEMATLWAHQPGGPSQCLMIGRSEAPITCAKGLVLLPHASFATAPPLDVLLVPGGQGTRTEVNNAELIAFLQHQSTTCRAVLSVCTGAFLLHAAGLLSGRRATTHWASLERLRALGDVVVVEERFTRDGAVWTAAGIASGLDLMLHFIAETAGDDVAAKVQLESEYFPASKIYGNAASSGQGSAYFRT